MSIVCYWIATYGDALVWSCIAVNLTNLWIAKIVIEPDRLVIAMFLLGLLLISLLVILILLNNFMSLC